MSDPEDSASTKPLRNHVASLEDQSDARRAAKVQKDMTLRQALQGNWKAALWSAIISLTIIMEGYDVGGFEDR